ncbi:MAG: universal stress protein, partial [Verrucomicrobiae bacterium]|nr:universal stress protein [Verrucomicrobiae bacterium]NNJ85757.1 universal stress protein [Akkermansiaceae bacterium]
AVTPGANPAFSKILVPVDFSSYARLALDTALAFAESRSIRKIQCVHAFELYRGFERTGLSKRRAIIAHREWAEVEFAAFTKDIDCRGVEVELNTVQNASTAYAVSGFARRESSDLVVMGCRGKNAVSSWLLGSNTAQVLRSSRVPVLMIKEKGTGKTFLQSVLGD